MIRSFLVRLNLIHILVIVLLVVMMTYNIYEGVELRSRSVRIEKIAKSVLDDEISRMQFVAENTFRERNYLRAFNDSLNYCYDLLRMSIKDGCIHDEDYLKQFIQKTLPQRLSFQSENICLNYSKIECDSIFNLSCLEKIDAIKDILNPTWYASHYQFVDADIYEKRKIDIMSKDSTTLIIRLLKGQNTFMHNLELIENKNMKLISPYAGELKVYRKDFVKSKQEIRFSVYDWIENDTIEQSFIFFD